MSGLALVRMLATPPTSIAATATCANTEPGVIVSHAIASTDVTASSIHPPAAVTQRRARFSGKLQASFTLA